MVSRNVARNNFASDLLQGNPFVAVDIGARGDIPQHWVVLDGTANFISFEPDAMACKALEQVYARRGNGHLYKIVPTALSEFGGEQTLYIPKVPSWASLLPLDVNHPIVRDYSHRRDIFPVRSVKIPTQSLQSVLDSTLTPSFQIAKLDVQGTELSIIRGLRSEVLDQVMAIEIEVGINSLYSGQPTLVETDSYFRREGFELFNANPARLHQLYSLGRTELRKIFGVRRASLTFAARLLEFDALYFRSPERVLEEGAAGQVLQLAAAYSTYCYFGEAWALLDQAETRAILSEETGSYCKGAVVRWHKSRPYARYSMDGIAITSARRVLTKLRLGRARRWSQYQWRYYPSA